MRIAPRTAMRSLFVVACSCVLAACSASSSSDAPGGSPNALPARCEALPSFADATARLDARLAESARGASFVEPASAYARTAPLSLGHDLAKAGDPDDDRLKVPRILRSEAEMKADASLAWMATELTIDWSKEVAVVVEEHPSDTRYRYAVVGDAFRVVSARAQPCLSAGDAVVQESALAAARPRIFRVPSSVQRAVAEAVTTEEYRPALPRANGACTRKEGTVFAGGGNASIVRGHGALRLYVNGFGAMTGNVFFVESKDEGATFTPNGSAEENLSRFTTRHTPTSTSRITVDGEERLYFVRDGRVRLTPSR